MLFAVFIGEGGNVVKQGKNADGTEVVRIMRKKSFKVIVIVKYRAILCQAKLSLSKGHL